MPPIAEKKPSSLTAHGISWTDDYAWLRDLNYPVVDDPKILAYLEAENGHFETWTNSHADLIPLLHAELKGRLKADDASVPVRDGAFEYHWSFQASAQYRTWFRRDVDAGLDPMILLDEPVLAADHDYWSLRALAVSPRHDLLAYSSDTVGDERYRIKLKSLSDDQDLDFEIVNTSGAVVWDRSGRYLFYVELNEQLRPFRVRRCDRLSPAESDAIVFEESDAGVFVSIGRTSDRHYLTISAGDHVSRQVSVLSLNEPLEPARCISARRDHHRYNVDHANGFFYILTNDQHENFRLVKADAQRPSEKAWEEIISGSDQTYLLDFDCFETFVALKERSQGQSHLRILNYTGESHLIDFGQDVYSAAIGDNREFATDRVRVSMSSPITPATIFDYLIDDRVLIKRKVQEIPSGFDETDYRCERIWADAADGARVPITVIRHKETKVDGRAPLLLYGYGAYGMGLEPAFSPHRFSLLDRGVIYATAHVRGGNELGHGWYQQGKLVHKTNTFSDFITCAETLIANAYTMQGQIAIMGGSAGGMLVGAVLNERPDLWGAAVAQVPFVDVLNTMMDSSLPLTPIEWPEWGDPIKEKDAFLRIMSYSPYDNVRQTSHPAILVTAGISDPRVTYWEPAKWVAKLRTHQTGDAPIYLKTNMGAGHFGVSGRFDMLTESAQIYAFILEHLNVPQSMPVDRM